MFSPSLSTLQIAAGNFHVLVLTAENEVYFWGRHLKEHQAEEPKKIRIFNVKDISAIRGCSVSCVETMEGKVYFWGFANGHVIPEPTLTNFSSMDEVFASLDCPMMLKPVHPQLKQPAFAEKLSASFDDKVKF